MNTEPEDEAAYKEWFIQQVQIGIDAADAGELIPDEVVRAEAAAWRAEVLRKIELAEQNKAA